MLLQEHHHRLQVVVAVDLLAETVTLVAGHHIPNIAAVLAHDMLEDTPVKLADLPVGDRVREAVRLVSKNEYDHRDPAWEDKYFSEIRRNPLACMVKCLDRVNNLAGMADAFTWGKMVKYTAETDKYYPALLDVLKKVPEWNDAWWLLRYQMNTITEAFKRLL